jgi:hypothetical protein
MELKMSKLYIYIANRNKDGIKILTTLTCSQKFNYTKINDVSKIGLESELENSIINYYDKYKMHWDLMIESADSFKSLKDSLKNRGFYNLPLFSSSLFQEKFEPVVKTKQKTNIVIKSNDIKSKTMLRKA